MAMNFAKNNRSIAFNPTSAFPLDARSYFESYAAAVAAAAIAEEVGSTNTVYYYGQTIAVVENNIATLYIIQPNKTLSPVFGADGGQIQTPLIIDSKQFAFDENGALSLRDFQEAHSGDILIVGPEGNLGWQKLDVYTKSEIDSKIIAAGHLKRKIIDSIVSIAAYMEEYDDADQYIFMVPREDFMDSNKYDEYIVIKTYNDDGTQIAQEIEAVGSWEVDLEEYAKKEDLTKYVEITENGRLITNAEINKLANLVEGAEHNVINSVSTDFVIDNNRQLNLNKLSQDQIIGLEDSLATKVDKNKDSDMLLSALDRSKLNALQLNDDDLQISGQVFVSQIVDFQEWLESHAANQKGLSEHNLTDDLFNKLDQGLSIRSLNEDQLQINDGELNIKQVKIDQVESLESVLAEKATTLEVAELQLKTETLQLSLNKNISRIDSLEDSLIWKEI